MWSGHRSGWGGGGSIRSECAVVQRCMLVQERVRCVVAFGVRRHACRVWCVRCVGMCDGVWQCALRAVSFGCASVLTSLAWFASSRRQCTRHLSLALLICSE